MRFQRLAAALGLAALEVDGDEDRAVTAVEALSRRATAAETSLATTRTELGQAKDAIRVAMAAGVKTRIDGILGAAYRDGKLRHGRDEHGNAAPSAREGWLRKLATRDGVEALEAEIAELPVVVPVNARPRAEGAGEPPRRELGAPLEPSENPYYKGIAEQLGIKEEDMVAYAENHVYPEGY